MVEMVMDLENIAEEFAQNVAAQTDAIWCGDRKGGYFRASTISVQTFTRAAST